MSATDTALYERWQRKSDAEAFAEIVSRYSGMVYGTCRRILRNDADAEDAAQECFIELMRARVDPSPTLGPWLHTVAVRRSLDRFKSARRRYQREIIHAQTQENVQSAPDTAAPDTAELLGLIDEAIVHLPESIRGLIIGRFLENRTHVELAATVGVSEATVRYRLERGIEQVRSLLKKRGVLVSASALAGVMGSELAEAAPASMVAALGKLALGGALPSIRAVASAAAKTSVLNALTASKAGMFLVAWVLIASVASLVYFAASPPGETVAQVSPVTDAHPAPVSDGAPEPVRYAAPVKEVLAGPEAPVPEAPAAKSQPEPCSIEGFIYDDAGQGIPDARVTAATWISGYDFRSMRSWYGQTDASGHYTISGILLTSYEAGSGCFLEFVDVSVGAAGFSTDGKRVAPIREGEHLTGINFKLSAGQNLYVRLLGLSGRPVPGAVVVCRSTSVSGGKNYHIASTDSYGCFTMGFRTDVRYEGIASLLAVSPEQGECFFPAVPIGEPGVVDLQMTKPANLSIKVTYADGVPAGNIGVCLIARYARDGGSPDFAAQVDSWNGAVIDTAYHRSVTTRPDGTYTFTNLPAVPDVMFSFSDQPLGKVTIEFSDQHPLGIVKTGNPKLGVKLLQKDAGPLLPGENKIWSCSLPTKAQTMRVEVRVLGEPSGEPIPAGVWFENTVTHSKEFCEVGPDIVGRDVTSTVSLATAGTYEVWPRYRSTHKEEDRQQYGRILPWKPGSSQTIDLVLPDPFTMSIRVVDPAGQPVPRATVEATIGTIFRGGQTDEDGRYGWNGFAPGVEAYFIVNKDGYLKAESQPIAGETGAVYPEETIVLLPEDSAEAAELAPDGM